MVQYLCPGMTFASMMAQAVNLAVDDFRDIMDLHVSEDELDPETESFYAYLHANLDAISNDCSGSGTSTGVHPTKALGSYEAACGTVFTTFNQTHINGCN